MNITNNKGMIILLVTYLVIGILLILGIAFFSRIYSENKITERQRYSIQALGIAEGGVDRAFYELRQDFINDTTDPSWLDGDINGIPFEPSYENFAIFLEGISLGSGSYTVELKNVVGKDDEIWVRSTGTIGDIQKIIQTYVKMENFSIWENAIFAGTGSGGMLINGNVDIRGSVHLLGTGLESTDFALDMSGNGNIANNYEGIPTELGDRIPSCPTTIFNDETVESLGANVRIKHGKAGLSGTATIGLQDSPGNSYKETMDGVFITDGYGGTQGENSVYSDNGTQNGYDLGDSIEFPSLEDPYLGYPTYQEYLEDNALVISAPNQLAQLANITPNSTFTYTDPENKGSISIDGNGNLAISGIVYVDGGNLNMNKQGNNNAITYSGTGSILVEGTVGINVNLLTPNVANSFPNNVLGIMTPNTINFNAAQINVMGLFYAEDEIISQKQTSVAGTFMSNYFDMSQQVPSIYQVPDIVNNLPLGMIGSDPIWIIVIVAWQEL